MTNAHTRRAALRHSHLANQLEDLRNVYKFGDSPVVLTPDQLDRAQSYQGRTGTVRHLAYVLDRDDNTVRVNLKRGRRRSE